MTASIDPVRGGRYAVRVAALLVAVLLVSCGGSSQLLEPSTSGEAGADGSEETPEPSEDVPDEPAIPSGEPVRVTISAIGVDAELVELGLDDNDHMEVPDFGYAGWYTEGPRPGHPGPSVIAAHVDSKSGPDVFYRLKELEPGDEVSVTYDTGGEVIFEVETEPLQTPKDELPGDEIWPVTNERLLTLITCGGIFDRSIGHYEDNIIVRTRLKDVEESA